MERDSGCHPTHVVPTINDGMFVPFGENSMHSDWHKNYTRFLTDSSCPSDNPKNWQSACVVSSPLSLKLPYDLPAFTGVGDQDFWEWIALFQRTTKACQVGEDALLDCLDAYLDGPAAFELTKFAYFRRS